MIKAVDLSKKYAEGATALLDVNLEIQQGEMVFLRGPSGAGKTTLFRMILGMESPSSGEIVVAGRPMCSQAVRQLRRRIGVVFQDFRLLEGRSARENVEIGMRVLGVTGQQMHSRAQRQLRLVGLEDREDAVVGSLSWGERQRVAVARALARRPDIILADEPTGNLDEKMSQRVLSLLSAANGDGATVVVAIHSPEVLHSTTRRVITLTGGRIVDDRPAQTGGIS